MTQDSKEQKEATDPVAAIRENLNSAKDTLSSEDVSESALISDLKDELTDSSDSTVSSDTTSISIDPNALTGTVPSSTTNDLQTPNNTILPTDVSDSSDSE